MATTNVDLAAVLEAKEKRYARQQRLRQTHGLALASLTINMPGAVKDLPVLRRLCEYGVRELSRRFPPVAVEAVYLPTGPEALLVIGEEADAIKREAVRLEEAQTFGRLLDIDVFDKEGQLLSRKSQGQGRGCFVCGQEASICMRERRHTPAELQQAVTGLLQEFLAWEARSITPLAEKIGSYALESMLYEAACTPAPGLVDRDNSGAHQDMDFYTFMASSAALAFPMACCAQAGMNHEGALSELLPVVRIIGQKGEQAMFAATDGVNTQKGLLFVLGILSAAAGYAAKQGGNTDPHTLFRGASAMTEGIVERELFSMRSKPKEKLTYGEKLYINYGITGVRGEIEAGLPSAAYALPALREALDKGLSLNDALVQALLVLMTCAEDTTVIHRHDPDMLRSQVRQKAGAVLAAGGMFTKAGRDGIKELDEEFIKANVSPGGAADLLAALWFAHRLGQG